MEGGEEGKCYCLEGDSFSFLSLFFHDVDGLCVRNSRCFVFRKSVHKPNCSLSEVFMNQGLTVQEKIALDSIALKQHIFIHNK